MSQSSPEPSAPPAWWPRPPHPEVPERPFPCAGCGTRIGEGDAAYSCPAQHAWHCWDCHAGQPHGTKKPPETER